MQLQYRYLCVYIEIGLGGSVKVTHRWDETHASRKPLQGLPVTTKVLTVCITSGAMCLTVRRIAFRLLVRVLKHQ